jgi:hypothetical protein
MFLKRKNRRKKNVLSLLFLMSFKKHTSYNKDEIKFKKVIKTKYRADTIFLKLIFRKLLHDVRILQ